MAFLQRLRETCDDHDGCHAIECETDADIVNDEDYWEPKGIWSWSEDGWIWIQLPDVFHPAGEVIHLAGSIVWISHAPDHTHPDCRANPDHPMEGYDSTREMCEDCRPHFSP